MADFQRWSDRYLVKTMLCLTTACFYAGALQRNWLLFGFRFHHPLSLAAHVCTCSCVCVQSAHVRACACARECCRTKERKRCVDVYVCVHVCASAGVSAQVCVRSSVFQCGAIQCAYSQVVAVNALSARVTEGVPINNTLSLPGLSRIRKLRMPHVFSCASVASESVCVHVRMYVRVHVCMYVCVCASRRCIAAASL